MTYDYQIGDGAHALDVQEFLDWKRGYQVVDAAGGSNLVDDNATSDLTIRAAAGDINAGGTTVTCSQDTIDLSGDVDPDDPRKVTVYRTPAGALATSAGTPEPAQDAGESRRNAYRPSPPTLSGTDGVVLATVWLPAGASSVTNADIRDRRLPAELPLAQTSFADLGTDPAANGEVQRNGTDLKAYSGGAVRNLSDIGGQETATIDDTDSPFTTSDEAVVYADTSAGAVTVTLSSADAALGNEIRVVNIDGSNAVTVDTEGAETIDPNADPSKTITQAGWGVSFTADGSNWDSTLAAEHESVSTDEASIGQVVGQARPTSDKTIPTGTFTQVGLDEAQIEDSDILTVDLANDKITVTTDGTYVLKVRATYRGSADWSAGDEMALIARDATNSLSKDLHSRGHTGRDELVSLYAEATYRVSGDTDFILFTKHERGGDETISSNFGDTNIEVRRLG